MPFNLLLFPLVGGYYIIAYSEWYRYKTQRLQSERLIFNSVIAGCILLFITFIIKSFVFWCSPDLVIKLKGILPIKQNYFGVMIASFIIALIGTEVANIFISKTKHIKKAIERIGNDLEKLLMLSADTRDLIQVTLSGGKVYVGICSYIPVPDKTSYFELVPFLSGYRDPVTKIVTFNTSYLDVYAEYIKEGAITSIDDLKINLVIKTEEVLTANRFDLRMYEMFNHSGGAENDQESIN